MATLKGKYTEVAASTDTLIGKLTATASSAKGKIAEIIIANEGTAAVNYTIKLNRPGTNEIVHVSPTTTLAAGDVHVKPMSTFIQGNDELRINASGPVKTAVSIIEL